MRQGTSGRGRILLECCQTNPAERKLFLDFFKTHNRILKRHITSAILDRNPTLLDIRRALSNHSPVIALVDSYYTSKARGARNPPHLPHWIVIRGYEGEKFHVNDSTHESGLKTGKMVVKEQLLKEGHGYLFEVRLTLCATSCGIKENELIPYPYRVSHVG
jgi:hypothetical protein